MRVCCTERDDRYRRLRFTAVGPLGERRVSEGPEATDASAPLTVEGFAPNGADEWVLEGIDAQGVAHEIRSESSTPRP